MSNCAICGRELRTGRKYCHIHRGYSGVGYRKRDTPIPLGLMFVSIAIIIMGGIIMRDNIEGLAIIVCILLIGIIIISKSKKYNNQSQTDENNYDETYDNTNYAPIKKSNISRSMGGSSVNFKGLHRSFGI